MSRSSRLLLPLVSLALALPLLSCASRHDSDEKYYLISTNLQVPYWKAAGAGFMQAAAQLKVKAEFTGPNGYDPKEEQNELRRTIAAKPAGILISTADAALMRPDIDAAIAAGIPVITMDSDAPGSKRLFFIGTNNYGAGVTGGKRVAEELHGKGNVVVFTYGQANLEERLRGYRDAFAEHPQIKITRVVDIKGDPRNAFDTATEIIGKEKDKVDAFVCLEAVAGKEVATVLDSNGVKGKVLVAMDTDPDTLDWIQKGVIAATISQKPYTMAFLGLKMLDDLHHNKLSALDSDWTKDSFAPIPTFVDTGSALIDKGNVQAFLQSKQSATGSSR
jgi:ribose transport system substrate-binding protein